LGQNIVLSTEQQLKDTSYINGGVWNRVNRMKLHLFYHKVVFPLSWHTEASKWGNGIHHSLWSTSVWCYCLLVAWTSAAATGAELHSWLPKAAREQNTITTVIRW
jgi:hypothetical protein